MFNTSLTHISSCSCLLHSLFTSLHSFLTFLSYPSHSLYSFFLFNTADTNAYRFFQSAPLVSPRGGTAKTLKKWKTSSSSFTPSTSLHIRHRTSRSASPSPSFHFRRWFSALSSYAHFDSFDTRQFTTNSARNWFQYISCCWQHRQTRAKHFGQSSVASVLKPSCAPIRCSFTHASSASSPSRSYSSSSSSSSIMLLFSSSEELSSASGACAICTQRLLFVFHK